MTERHEKSRTISIVGLEIKLAIASTALHSVERSVLVVHVGTSRLRRRVLSAAHAIDIEHVWHWFSPPIHPCAYAGIT